MKTLHIVTGSTGEYYDRGEWLVRAFRTKVAAQRYCTKCSEAAATIFAAYTGSSRYDILDKANKFDPGMQMDYTGTHYYVQTCPVSE